TKDENIWVYTFEGLPKYNDNGEEIEYTADEEERKVNDLMFYEKEVNGLIVTNTFQVPDERIDEKVNKVWVDNDIQEARRPESVLIILNKKVNTDSNEDNNSNESDATQEELQEIARHEITISDAVSGNKDRWKYTFENLP